MYYRSEIALEHVNSRREGYRRMSGGVKTSLCLRDFSVLKRSLLLLRKWINSIHLLIPYGISDSAVGFASTSVKDLLALMD